MNVLLDTDVVLDLLLEREGFVEAAAALFDAQDAGEIRVFVSAITPLNVFYIAAKVLGRQNTEEAIYELLGSVDVCTIDYQVLQQALSLSFKDYEDAVQVASALSAHLGAIVTRNLPDYRNSPLPVYSPSDFLTLLSTN